VPNVTSLERKDAQKTLDDAGLESLLIERDVSSQDDVLSQTPRAGATIPRGSLVIVYVVG
ncbi:MAG: PASTA domain-containing protein, partial [Gaiellaceae bacterium]